MQGSRRISDSSCWEVARSVLLFCWEVVRSVLLFIVFVLTCCWCICLRGNFRIYEKRSDDESSNGNDSSYGGNNGFNGGQGWGDPRENTGYDQQDRYPRSSLEPRRSTSAPKTKINIKAGKGVTIIAGASTLENAQIDVESRTGQNNIVALGQNGDYTVTTSDGHLQKAARGEYVHTPGTALTGGSTIRPEITYP